MSEAQILGHRVRGDAREFSLKHSGLGATQAAHNDGRVDRRSEHVTGDLCALLARDPLTCSFEPVDPMETRRPQHGRPHRRRDAGLDAIPAVCEVDPGLLSPLDLPLVTGRGLMR